VQEAFLEFLEAEVVKTSRAGVFEAVQRLAGKRSAAGFAVGVTGFRV
jgi:hypothetical protein